MASKVTSQSLQRTDSTGNLNVFILLEVKSTGDLLIVSREQLPPALRVGKLVLNQKITIRGDDRNNIEGVIIYMHADRTVCSSVKKRTIEKKCRQQGNENRDNSFEVANSPVQQTSRSQITISDKSTKKIVSKNSTEKPVPTPKKAKMAQSNKRPLQTTLNLLASPEYHEDDVVHNTVVPFDPENSLLSACAKSNQNEKTNTTFDDTINASSTFVDTNENEENDYLLRKINQLSLKVSQHTQLLKERDAEIKRLKSTTIKMPADQATRDYIFYIADKVRHQTMAYQYNGSLAADAKRLGLSLQQINEILKTKGAMSSVARELFKKIVPEHRRQVDRWSELADDVLVKEKILIDFMERFYGPLEVDPKKIHTSLVGCLRNQRGTLKKQQQQADAHDAPEKDTIDIDHFDNVAADEHSFID